MIDLSSLPAPSVIAPLDFEAILAAMLADAAQRFADAGIDYDVGELETDPVKIILEAASYRELLLRARINDAARANLLKFASNGDLDHLAAFHGVSRLDGEADDRLAYRVILAHRDRNSAGTEPRYEFVAMSASSRVRRAVVYTVGRDPTVRVAVQSTDNNGAADASLLAMVTAAVTDPTIRMVNDTIAVESAVRAIVNVTAKAWLKPDAPTSTLAAIEPALRAAWATEGTLGRDLVGSWMASHMHVAGISRLEDITPARTVVPFNQFAAIGTVTIQNMGREF